MSAVVLALRADPGPLPVDMAGIVPERLAGMGEAEIAALPLLVGNRRLPLGELFRVEAGGAPHLLVDGATRSLDRLGAGMAAGVLEIRGDAGAYVGLGLRRGHVLLHGSAGDFVGAEMRGGRIVVRGDAGAFAGASLPGSMHGMAGGAILITGDAGDRAGDRMRRGTIAVAGAAGGYTAARMIGGTLMVGGACGGHPGYGMRRGSLLLGLAPAEPSPLFVDGGVHDLPWLRLLHRHLASLGWASLGWQPPPFPTRVRRLTGDVTAGGKGELLIATSA